MSAEPVCEIGSDRTLRVWFRADDAPVTVAIDGVPMAATGVEIQGGTRLRLAIPEGARMLRISARAEGGTAAVYTMPLRDSTLSPELRLAAAKRHESLDEAEKLARPFVDASDLRTRAAALGILGRIHRARGDSERAAEELLEAAELHRQAGFPSEALKDELALAFTRIYHGWHLSEARAALRRAADPAPTGPDAGSLSYYEGLLAYETADYLTAMVRFRETIAVSARTETNVDVAGALSQLAFCVQVLGREKEATALIGDAETLASSLRDPCHRAELWDTIAWFRAHAPVQHARRNPSAALAAFQQALALREATKGEERCDSPRDLATLLTDVAVISARSGRIDEARGYLDRARSLVEGPRASQMGDGADATLLAYWREIEAEAALASGRPSDALAAANSLADLGEAGGQLTMHVRGELCRARAFEALGETLDADRAYARAEAIVTDGSLRVPMSEGRLGFLDTFGEVARRRVASALRTDPAVAATAARRSLARALRLLRWSDRIHSIPERERATWDGAVGAFQAGRAALEKEVGEYWKLPGDQLARVIERRRERERALQEAFDRSVATLWSRGSHSEEAFSPPRPDEVILVYHPLPVGFVGFAITPKRTVALPVEEPAVTADPAEIARKLLLPFKDSLVAARRARFIVPGAWTDIDFHALPWEGAPLIASMPVTYGVDLRAPNPGADDSPVGTALVVVDPTGDLPSARAEGRTVVEALRTRGQTVHELAGNQATFHAVRDALQGQSWDLLHYGGHGQFTSDDDWQSSLRLADHTELKIGDVLALANGPRLVVLAACEGARTTAASTAAGLGLAQAFVVSGAAAVVASPRPVHSALAAEVMTELHRSWPGTAPAPQAELAEKLQQAVLAVRARMPDADWASFRVLVP